MPEPICNEGVKKGPKLVLQRGPLLILSGFWPFWTSNASCLYVRVHFAKTVNLLRLVQREFSNGAPTVGPTGTGEDHFLEPKKPVCLRPRKWDCCSDLFCEKWRSINKSNTSASVTEWQDSGEHGSWLKVSSPACMLPIFAKAPCCLELFGCCCRRLSQHGVGEVLIPLRHCWPDAFFCFCVGSGSFCHDWASHCSVLFWSLDALFVFGLPPSPP